MLNHWKWLNLVFIKQTQFFLCGCLECLLKTPLECSCLYSQFVFKESLKTHQALLSSLFIDHNLYTRCMTCVFARDVFMNTWKVIKQVYIVNTEGSMTVWDSLTVCLYTNGHLNESSPLSHWILPPINLKAKWSNNLINAPFISLSPCSSGTHVSILTFGCYKCTAVGVLSGFLFFWVYSLPSTEDVAGPIQVKYL